MSTGFQWKKLLQMEGNNEREKNELRKMGYYLERRRMKQKNPNRKIEIGNHLDQFVSHSSIHTSFAQFHTLNIYF